MNWVNGAGVRPEVTRVSRCEPVNGTRSVRAVVQSCTFFGSCVHVQARTAEGGSVVAEVPREICGFSAGEAVHMWWQPRDEITGLQS